MTSADASTEQPLPAIRIRKYPNRRLYCSDEKRFVTLDEIATWIRNGKCVEVTDTESGKEITSEILTQILLEGGRAQHFPVQLLEQMIRLNESTLKGFWEVYLNQSLHMLLGVQREMESFYQNLSPLFSAFSPLRAFQAHKTESANLAPDHPESPAAQKPKRRSKPAGRKAD